jgi:hypothetical protein
VGTNLKKDEDDSGVREAFRGLFVGLVMMAAAVLLAHFFLGMPILQ